MVFPRLAYKTDLRETSDWYKAIAGTSDLPIMVYNNPIAYGVDVTPAGCVWPDGAVLLSQPEDPAGLALQRSNRTQIVHEPQSNPEVPGCIMIFPVNSVHHSSEGDAVAALQGESDSGVVGRRDSQP